MDLVRKAWLHQSDQYLRLITEKEKYLALLKKEKAPAFRIKSVEDEINFLVDFYNNTEQIMKVHELEYMHGIMTQLLLGNEIRQLIRMLTDLRNLSADPEAFMELISKVHDSASETLQDTSLLKPDKKFRREVDKYFKKVMKISKDEQEYANNKKAS